MEIQNTLNKPQRELDDWRATSGERARNRRRSAGGRKKTQPPRKSGSNNPAAPINLSEEEESYCDPMDMSLDYSTLNVVNMTTNVVDTTTNVVDTTIDMQEPPLKRARLESPLSPSSCSDPMDFSFEEELSEAGAFEANTPAAKLYSDLSGENPHRENQPLDDVHENANNETTPARKKDERPMDHSVDSADDAGDDDGSGSGSDSENELEHHENSLVQKNRPNFAARFRRNLCTTSHISDVVGADIDLFIEYYDFGSSVYKARVGNHNYAFVKFIESLVDYEEEFDELVESGVLSPDAIRAAPLFAFGRAGSNRLLDKFISAGNENFKSALFPAIIFNHQNTIEFLIDRVEKMRGTAVRPLIRWCYTEALKYKRPSVQYFYQKMKKI